MGWSACPAWTSSWYTKPKITRLKVPPEQRRRARRATVQKEKAEKAFNSLVNDDEFVTNEYAENDGKKNDDNDQIAVKETVAEEAEI